MEASGIDDVKIPLLQASEENVTVRTVAFQISDIKCASCVNSIESALRNLDGVKSIAVSPLDGRASIKFVPKLITVSHTFIATIVVIIVIRFFVLNFIVIFKYFIFLHDEWNIVVMFLM